MDEAFPHLVDRARYGVRSMLEIWETEKNFISILSLTWVIPSKKDGHQRAPPWQVFIIVCCELLATVVRIRNPRVTSRPWLYTKYYHSF